MILAGLIILLVVAITVFFSKSEKPLFTPVGENIPTKNLPEPSVVKKTTILWGAYTGWLKSQVEDFEKKVGRQTNYLAAFVHWGNESEFPAELADFAKKSNKTLIIFWEAMDYNITSPGDPRFSYSQILGGKFDQYIFDFAKAAKDYGGPIILVPFEEMNGNWYPWSVTQNGNSAAEHIRSYRYLKNFFFGISNVKFGWAVNSLSEPDVSGNKIEELYPGKDYVDFVGVNGFNFGEPWQSFEEIFGSVLQKLAEFNKPIIIFSMACADGGKKAEWIEDALIGQIPKYPNLVGWSWFNENKEKDWRVWSDANSLKSFQKSLP